jgi:hypothetical protein
MTEDREETLDEMEEVEAPAGRLVAFAAGIFIFTMAYFALWWLLVHP